METIIPWYRFPNSSLIEEYLDDKLHEPFGRLEYHDSHVERNPNNIGEVRHTASITFSIESKLGVIFIPLMLSKGWKVRKAYGQRWEQEHLKTGKAPTRTNEEDWWRCMMAFQQLDHDDDLWDRIDAYESLDDQHPF